MLPIVWKTSARNDLRKIITYIASESPMAARKMKNLLDQSILPAAHFPYMYRASERIPGLREIVAHPNYIVLYRVTTRIEVVNIVHSRLEYPSS